MKAFEEGQKYPYKYIVKNSPSDRYLTYGIYSYIGDDKAKELIDLLYNKTSTTIVLFKSLNRKSYYFSYMVKIKYRDRNHAEKIHEFINTDINLSELEYTQHSSLDLDGSFKFLCVHKWGDVKMKPETQKHFGDIFKDSFITFKDYVIEASSQEEEWVLILKLRFGKNAKMGKVTEGGRYILKRAEELTQEEKEELDKLEPFKGFSEFDKGYSNGEGDIIFFDTRPKLNQIINYYKSFCKMEQVIPMKDKTKEHFGDIMEKTYSKTEGSLPKAEWVIILKFTKVGSDYLEETNSEITYTMKKVKDLTPEEIKMLKPLKPFHGFSKYKKAISNTEKDGKPLIAFFDTKEKVEWILWYYKQVGSIMTPSIPVKPKTKKHFGDIIN